MAEPPNDPLLREIDEELRQERLLALWKRYGRLISAAAVLLVVAVAGYQFWRYSDETRRAEATRTLLVAFQAAEDDSAAARDQLRALADGGPAGHAVLARFREAALQIDAGDGAEADTLYATLAETAPTPLLRDLARLLRAITLLADDVGGTDGEEVRHLLAPLTADDNPWRYSAREALAVLDLQHGRTTDARAALSALAADPVAPAGVRERAGQLLTQANDG